MHTAFAHGSWAQSAYSTYLGRGSRGQTSRRHRTAPPCPERWCPSSTRSLQPALTPPPCLFPVPFHWQHCTSHTTNASKHRCTHREETRAGQEEDRTKIRPGGGESQIGAYLAQDRIVIIAVGSTSLNSLDCCLEYSSTYTQRERRERTLGGSVRMHSDTGYRAIDDNMRTKAPAAAEAAAVQTRS